MAKHTPRDPATADSWKRFAKKLFTLYDADPGYYALRFTDMPEGQKKRAALAWCSYYNLGIAAQASEYTGGKFWEYLKSVYPTAVRASERRHFRGAAGLQAMKEWREAYEDPKELVNYILGADPYYDSIAKRAGSIRLFGDYFKWKWCDLYEVLTGVPVDFTGCESKSPKVPQQGAALIFPDLTVAEAYAEIVAYCRFKGMNSPVLPEKRFGIGEAETVCCVYKQYMSGSYSYGLRTAKAVARLSSVQSATGSKMVATLLGLSPWSQRELKEILAHG